VGGQLGTIVLWDVASRTEITTLTGHSSAVNSLAFSADGSLLVSGGDDKNVVIWDLARQAQLRVLAGHQGGVSSVSFSPDSSTIASGSSDGDVILWHVEPSPSAISRRTITSARNAFAVSFDGKVLLSSGDNGVALSDLSGDEPLSALPGSGGEVALTTDGRLIATRGATTPDILLWDLGTRTEVGRLPSDGGVLRSPIVFSPDGRMLASGEENEVTIWDVRERSIVGKLAVEDDGVISLAFSPDGHTLAAGNFHTVVL
jgi:WD40 repeat protein